MRLFGEFSVKLYLNSTVIIFLASLSEAKEQSLVELAKSCKAYDRVACNKLIEIQRKEVQQEPNPKVSLANRINCKKNDAQACFNEGFDQDAAGNTKESIKFYERACELQHAGACNNRGVLAARAKQSETAKTFHLKSCELGDMKACNTMGSIEIKNDDLHEAYKYFKKGCDSKVPYSCYNMGWVQAQWQNFKLADQYYQMACKEKLKDACENIIVIKDRLIKELENEQLRVGKSADQVVPCEKIMEANFLPLLNATEHTPFGSGSVSTVNSTLTKVNYEIFNRKKECGAKNIRLPLTHRLPYTGLEK